VIEWAMLKSFSRSDVKGQGHVFSDFYAYRFSVVCFSLSAFFSLILD